MQNTTCDGIEILDPETGTSLLKLFALLYADDTVILSDNKSNFQYALNIFSTYCKKWKLKINETKSNIMIFGTVKKRKSLKFSINEKPIKIVNTFTYLGLEFNKNGRYISAMKNNLSKVKRAAFSITKKPNHLTSLSDVKFT